MDDYEKLAVVFAVVGAACAVKAWFWMSSIEMDYEDGESTREEADKDKRYAVLMFGLLVAVLGVAAIIAMLTNSGLYVGIFLMSVIVVMGYYAYK